MNSNGPNLTIKFGSNGSTRKKGFSLTVKAKAASRRRTFKGNESSSSTEVEILI